MSCLSKITISHLYRWKSTWWSVEKARFTLMILLQSANCTLYLQVQASTITVRINIYGNNNKNQQQNLLKSWLKSGWIRINQNRLCKTLVASLNLVRNWYTCRKYLKLNLKTDIKAIVPFTRWMKLKTTNT